ncbi:hypothetical protein B0H13DRAFT_2283959 [Mycena leptocephala]|nr:hypothetical protein B0H13DRAFT_2283959 [Mycena leptocephala]
MEDSEEGMMSRASFSTDLLLPLFIPAHIPEASRHLKSENYVAARRHGRGVDIAGCVATSSIRKYKATAVRPTIYIYPSTRPIPVSQSRVYRALKHEADGKEVDPLGVLNS